MRPNVSRMSAGRQSSIALLAVLVLLAAVAGCGGNEDQAPAPSGAFDAERAFEDLRAQVELGPRPAGSPQSIELTASLAEKLEDAGARDVTIQRPWRNVVGTLPGSEPGYVVIGAHHDTKDGIPGFQGANDGASGVAVVLELARSLPQPLLGPSIAIALFDAEEARGSREFSEDGKRGSSQYVELAESAAQGSPPLDEIRAMVLFDMVGDCDLEVPYEGASDRGLWEAFSDADPDTFSGETDPIDDDHISFLERGIPAVDLIDFQYGPGERPGEYWHTDEDTLDKVCPESLDAIGEAAVEVLPTIR